MKLNTKIIILAIIIFTIQSCAVINKTIGHSNANSNIGTNNITFANYVIFDDVINGEGLDRATVKTEKQFFDYIMSNDISKKSQNPIYEVVLETSTDVYFGVVKKLEGEEKLIIDPFYSAPIEEVKLYFPGYFDITGANVKSKVFYYFYDRLIETKLKPICPNSNFLEYTKYKISLVEDGIKVNASLQGKCYEKVAFEKEIEATLDAENLDILKEYYLLKNYAEETQEEYGIRSETKTVFGGINLPFKL